MPPRRLTHDQHASIQGFRAVLQELKGSTRAVESLTGLTGAQLFLLQELLRARREGRALTVGEIARLADTSPGAASTLAIRLARKGLITRHVSKHDARRVELVLTEAGVKRAKRAPATTVERLTAAVTALSPETCRSLARGLVALSRELDADLSLADQLLLKRAIDYRPRRRRA